MKIKSHHRLTRKMRQAGVAALLRCRKESGHTLESVCQAVFEAMLAAADIHPGRNLSKSFAWSPHDRRTAAPYAKPAVKPPVRYDARGRRLPANPLKRSDFDADGVQTIALPDGTVHCRHICNFWYLLDEWKAEKAARLSNP